jgi:putative acetyltransferase
MAVSPEHQRRGIGSMLLKEGLKECKSKGYDVVVVLGYPEFYTRFGFTLSMEYGIKSEYVVPPDIFMVKELRNGALMGKSGTAKFHPLFSESL